MFDTFAAHQVTEDPRFFIAFVGRNDQRDRLADRFICAVAKKPFGGRIPGRDPGVATLADDGVLGGIADAGQQPSSRVELSQLADIAKDQYGADGVTRFGPNRSTTIVNGDVAAVLR